MIKINNPQLYIQVHIFENRLVSFNFVLLKVPFWRELIVVFFIPLAKET
jgi:hypothetical protein